MPESKIIMKANANRTKRQQPNYGGYNPSMLQPNAPLFQECPGLLLLQELISFV